MTLLVTGAVVITAAFYIWVTWSDHSGLGEFISELILLTRGLISYRTEYGSAAVYLICGAAAFFTAVFMYARFNFYALAVGGGASFFVCWLMDYRRTESDFILFLFCFLMLLIKNMNTRRKRQSFASLAALITLPVCAAAMLLANAAPGLNGAADNPLRTLIDKPLSAINEFLYLAFNPKYFSFQTTGFGKAGGELGGPVTLNSREIMRVAAPSRMYLSGATLDTYTGKAWEDGGFQPETTVYNTGHFELLETAAALVRNATVTEGANDWIWSGPFQNEDRAAIKSEDMPYLVTMSEITHMTMRSYDGFTGITMERIYESLEEAIGETFGLGGEWTVNQYFEDMPVFLRTYLPVGSVSIEVVQRTGSLFSPAKAWSPVIQEGENITGLTASAAGDFQIEGLFDEGDTYSYRYLNPNTGLTVMEDILNNARRGYYESNMLDTGHITELYNKLLRADIAAAYNEEGFDAKAAVLFNALLETYHYNNDNRPIHSAFNGDAEVPLPSARDINTG